MDKKLAIDLLGGTPAKAAALLEVTPSAVSQWPDDLPRRLADRVLGAAVRHGIDVQSHVQQPAAPAAEPEEPAHEPS
jgi:transcriptional repressor of cell division inhibition gene dicB